MKISFLFIFGLFITTTNAQRPAALVIQSGIYKQQMAAIWKDALQSRMSAAQLDSFARIKRPLSKEEEAWKSLIISKTVIWNTWRDSLGIPFQNIHLHDTVHILLGYLGNDDGFTYGARTVCFDVTAFYRAYGDAQLPENSNRIDRIFAHEYTHLLHKAWARKTNWQMLSFKDSIIWECWYEGMGNYRSLNVKWLPVNGELPAISRQTLDSLCPIFADRMHTIQTKTYFTSAEKRQIQANLSRGSFTKKWGAVPIAIWLALEARGNDNNLIPLINMGPAAVDYLASKYMTCSHK
jgi:hypothetical protein